MDNVIIDRLALLIGRLTISNEIQKREAEIATQAIEVLKAAKAEDLAKPTKGKKT